MAKEGRKEFARSYLDPGICGRGRSPLPRTCTQTPLLFGIVDGLWAVDLQNSFVILGQSLDCMNTSHFTHISTEDRIVDRDHLDPGRRQCNVRSYSMANLVKNTRIVLGT